MITPSKQQPRRPLFRVRFRDGYTVTIAAATSLKAEQKALRARPGFIDTVRIIKGKR
ncbi:hypothetical protein ACQZ4Q_04430 [Agrobacterium vitis]